MNKNSKTIAALLIVTAASLMIATVNMASAQTTDTETEGEQLLNEFHELAATEQEMVTAQEEGNVVASLQGEVENKIKEIKNKKQTVLEKLEKYEAKQRAKITISDEDKLKLEEARDLLYETDLPLTLVLVDLQKERLIVQFDKESTNHSELRKDVKDLVDVKVKFDFNGKGITLTGCTSATSDCDPLIGGIKIKSNTYTPGFTISLPVEQKVGSNWVDGFLTTGHTVTDNGEDIWQPVEGPWWNPSSTKIGDVNSGDRIFGGTCDCAFITKSTSTTSRDGVYAWPHNYFVISDKDDADLEEVVAMQGITSGYDTGTVKYKQQTTPAGNGVPSFSNVDLVLGFSTDQGDSGAPVFSNGEYHGIQIGMVEVLGVDHSIMVPWSNAESALDLR